MWEEFKGIIARHSHFVLTTHLNPDGDGIGSACALTEFLLAHGKSVRFVCDSPIPRKFAFLDYHGTHEIYNSHSDFNDIEVLIVLDTHKRERIGAVAEFIDRPGVITICIDHHPVDMSFTRYLAIDPKACAVGEMIYRLFKEARQPLNLRAATGIYASIVSDTGRFCYSSSGRLAHHIAEECIRLGVEPQQMFSKLFQHITLAETKLFAAALQGMETYFDGQIVIQQIRQEDFGKLGEKPEDLEHIDLDYIHDFNMLIEDVSCFILLREFSCDRVRVSLRSKHSFDISSVVQILGGGGHPNAAGLTWKGSLDDIKRKILELLQPKNGSTR